jgi:hypothetical protein
VKKIKLKKHNRIKYCIECGCNVEIVMVGLDGFCPNEMTRAGRYARKLYTIDACEKRDKK